MEGYAAGREQSYSSSQHKARLRLVGSLSLGFAGLLPSDHSHGLGCMTNILLIILLFKGNKDAKTNPRKQGVVNPEAAILFIEKNAVLKILMVLWDA